MFFYRISCITDQNTIEQRNSEIEIDFSFGMITSREEFSLLVSTQFPSLQSVVMISVLFLYRRFLS